MLECIEIIKNTFIEFIGTGQYIILYVLSLIYLMFKEKDKEKRMFFIYFQVLLFLVVFNPIFNKIVGPIFKSSIYWRVYWVIPFGFTIAYAIVKLITELDIKKVKKILLGIAFILVIMISGKFIFTEENYQKVDNWYKVPDESVAVTQIISQDKEEYKKAIVPETLVAYIRQIDSSIELAYKREAESYWNHPIVSALALGDTEKISNLAVKHKCNYIVVKKDKFLTLDFGYFGFNLFGETDEYSVYKYIGEIK